MTSVQPIDPNKPFADQLAAHSPDLLRDMPASVIQSLMSAEAEPAGLHRLPQANLAPDLVKQPPRNDSTRRSAAAPTSSASSPTAAPSSA